MAKLMDIKGYWDMSYGYNFNDRVMQTTEEEAKRLVKKMPNDLFGDDELPF